MNAPSEILSGCGWKLKIGTATRKAARVGGDFHAIYNGEDLGAPRKGVVAVIASALGAWEAAQIAVNGFAEGYYGSGGTLSAGRAAAQALSSINAWLYRQSQTAAPGHEMCAALSAVLFVNRRIDIVHIGGTCVLSLRGGAPTPLSGEPARGSTAGIGGQAAPRLEHYEYEVEPGDRLALLSADAAPYLHDPRLAALWADAGEAQAFADKLADALGACGLETASVVVADVIEPAHLGYEDIAARFAALPIRKPPREGELWDGFRIGRTINRGRYTLLKRAYDESEKRDVVLKIPLASMLADQVFRAGFLREAWIGTAVAAAGVARYYALPPDRQNSLYLVMPFYRGETLAKRLARAPRVELAEGIGIALKLSAAVAELGRHDIIHRDIKPENVILTAEGGVVLLDLGLAYLPGLDNAEVDNTGGTTRYMAPELFAGVAANDRTEVFSLAVTIYRMFTGKFPFGQRERRPLARLRPDLPAWLGDVLAKGLAMEPAERFAGAGPFAKALEDGLVGGDMRAANRLRFLTPLRQWQLATAVFAVATLLLLITGWRP